MPESTSGAEPWPLRLQALDAAEEEEKSAEASFELLGQEDVPAPPDIGDNLTLAPAEMTVAALQEALSKRGLDTKWNPLSANKKKELVDRLQVGPCAMAALLQRAGPTGCRFCIKQRAVLC